MKIKLAKAIITISTVVAMVTTGAIAQWNPVDTGPNPSTSAQNGQTISTSTDVTDSLILNGSGNTVNLPGGVTATGDGNANGVVQFNADGNLFNNWGTVSQGANSSGLFATGTATVNNWGSFIGNGWTGIQINGAGNANNFGSIVAATGTGISVNGGGVVFNDITGSVLSQNDAITISGGSTPSSVVNNGSVTSTGGNGIFINTGIDGSFINNAGSVNANQQGLWVNGNGSITNSGPVSATNGIGVWVNGSGTIDNSGPVNAPNSIGLWVNGTGTITNSNTVFANSEAIWVNGTGTIINNGGAVTSTGADGLWVNGDGVIINSGPVNANSQGLWVNGNGSITNSGPVTATFGIGVWVNGTGSITNNGAVTANNNIGLWVNGSGTVTNSAPVQASSQAIWVNGAGTVTNSGPLTSVNSNGIEIDGVGSVTNTAPINASQFGIFVNAGGANGNSVNNSAFINSVNSMGIFVNGGGDIINSGAVNANSFGIFLNGPGTLMNSGPVNSTNSIGLFISDGTGFYNYLGNVNLVHSSDIGMFLNGNGELENHGTVVSDNSIGMFLTGFGAAINYGTVRSNASIGLETVGPNTMVENTNGSIYGGPGSFAVGIFGNNSTFWNYGGSLYPGAGQTVALQFGASNVLATIGNWSHIGGIMDGGSLVGNSRLKFVFTGMSQADQDFVRNYVAANQNAGTFTFRGETYQWQNFQFTDFQGSSYEQQAQTPNQRAIGRNLDSFQWSPSADMQSVLWAIDSSTSVPDALEQLSPQKLQVLSTMSFNGAMEQTQRLQAHLDRAQLSTGGVDVSQVNKMDNSLDPKLAQTHSRLLAFNDFGPVQGDPTMMLAGGDTVSQERHVATSTAPEKRWGFFAAGNAEFADQDARDNQPKTNYTTVAMTTGVDYRVTDNILVGILGGYGQSDASLDAHGSSARVETTSIGVYGAYIQDRYYVNGGFDYGANTTQTTRNISFDTLNRTATGKADGDQWVGHVNGGYKFHAGKITYGPTAGLQYVNLSVDPINETGAGAASLNIAKQNADSLRSFLGAKASYDGNIGPVRFMPVASLQWVHEILDDSRGITANFNEPGLGSFTVNTTTPERDYALLGLSLNAELWQCLTLFVDYNAQVGQDDFFAHSVDGGARFAF